MRNDVSIVVKTFERPAALDRLLSSILASPAAGCRVLVADDSRRPRPPSLTDPSIEHFALPYDSGLSHGRNFLVDRVTTPYCVVLDDDFVFIPQTDVALLLEIVRDRGFDLAAGAVQGIGRPGHASIRIEGRDLYVTRGASPRGEHAGLPVYDMVDNFFLASTASLREVRWDERFKIYGEHIDFFYRYSSRYRVTYTDRVAVGHGDDGYTLRGTLGKYWPGRGFRSSRIFGRKHGIERVNGKDIFGVRGVMNFYLPAFRPFLSRAAGSLRWS